mmetsp:Transcript_19912/g.46775  ORF Transcript_19912/g.46775 Transcript_19912/m.46775 type:complete len:261 (+) Transcript_19912:274-1056(+)
MPTGRPIIHSSFAMSAASSEWMGTTSSMISRSRTAGTRPAPIPCILCGPCSPIFSPPLAAVINICSIGSTATVFISGFNGLMNCETPETVPPVPTPLTNISISPSVSFQISGPVVSRCILTFASFSNCCRIIPFPSGRPATISFALARAPGTAVSFGVSTTSAPNDISIIRRSTDIVSGIVKMHLYPLSRAIKARAIPVLPDVGSTSTDSPGVKSPFASASSIIDRPRRSFTLEHGPRLSSLPYNFTPFDTSTPRDLRIF